METKKAHSICYLQDKMGFSYSTFRISPDKNHALAETTLHQIV